MERTDERTIEAVEAQSPFEAQTAGACNSSCSGPWPSHQNSPLNCILDTNYTQNDASNWDEIMQDTMYK